MRTFTKPEEYEKMILDVLGEVPICIMDVRRKINTTHKVTGKYLKILLGKGAINMVKIGNSKCYLRKTKLLQEKPLDEKIKNKRAFIIQNLDCSENHLDELIRLVAEHTEKIVKEAIK